MTLWGRFQIGEKRIFQRPERNSFLFSIVYSFESRLAAIFIIDLRK